MLFPNALVVPGPQHIVDSVASQGIERLPHWRRWESSAKTLSQWLSPVNHRRWLKQKVIALREPLTLQRVASLDTGCDKFAKWRWKTIGNVTRDLQRMGSAFRRGVQSVGSAKAIGGRNAGQNQQLWDLAWDDAFWRQNEALHRIVQPLTDMASRIGLQARW